MNWYKQAQQKIVSFDFDSTIFMLEFDDEEGDYKRDPETGWAIGTPNPSVIEMIKKYNQDGWKVIIVSSRSDQGRQQIEDLVRELGLPVQEIYCTNGEAKVNTLIRLGVSKHYDDDMFEVAMIREKSKIEVIRT